MNIISAPRGTGKTTKLVYDLLEHENAVLVVSTTQRKDSMRPIVRMVLERRAHRADLVSNADVELVLDRVLTCDDIRRGDLNRREVTRLERKRVLVDDLEDVLFYFLGAEVRVATTSVRANLVTQ